MEETKNTTEHDAPKLSFKEHVQWIWRYWRPHRHVLVFMLFFTLLSTTVAVAYPLVFRWVIDRVSGMFEAGGESESIRSVMLILGAIAFAHFVSRLYPAARAMVNARLERDIRDDVFGRLMLKDYHFNNKFRTGDIVTRLTDDIAEFPKVAWFSCSGIFRALESASKLVFCLGAMIIMSWKLTALAVIPLPIMMWVFYRLRHKMRYYMEESQKCVSTTNNLLESAFTGIRIVKAFSAEHAQESRLAAILRDRVDILYGLVKLQTILWSLDEFAARLGQMVVIGYGGFLVISGDLSVGTLFAFYVYLDMLTHPMMDIPFLFMTGQQAFVSIDRVEEIKGFPITEPRPTGEPFDGIEEIAFEGVTFSYDGSRRNVDDVSFVIPAGHRVALVGPVACGKSTVLKLIAGIVGAQKGRILVNGKPLAESDWESYRKLIGYVPQEALLFSKSIKENVLFGRTAPEDFRASATEGGRADTVDPAGSGDASDAVDVAWTERCLAVAQMDDDLKTLPRGTRTVVGQKGSLVSGGQKQRIAIARALAGKPQVLLLDDCTAALDARNEDRFWSRLDSEMESRITFVVSHRLATIRRADTILVFDDGRLTDHGCHDELVERSATYREFLQTEQRKAHLAKVAGGGVSPRAARQGRK